MDKEISDLQGGQKTLWTDVNLLEDRMMDMEMSTSGAHRMIGEVKDNVRDLNDLATNINNQVERIQVEDISWCWSRISLLEKPNNLSGTIALFTHFSLFFLSFRSLTHIPLS